MDRLGKYELIRRLATGGMAELFLARTSAAHGFEKTVVLKRILPAFADDEDFIKMFLAEARLAAGLHHPNIAQVYDIGEEDGAHFFAMEYVHGKDLRKVVPAALGSETGFPLPDILQIVIGIAAGLHHAHEHTDADGNKLGIVHRDVSPANVLVTFEGDVKVVDFGIAKAAALGSGTLAGAGGLKGKIPYMSPEQCRGELVDRRSDIFSMGTLLWELSVGRRLFRPKDGEAVLIQQVARGEVPKPSSVRSDYPAQLEEIVLTALACDRDKRFQTALDFRIALEEFARRKQLPVSSARTGKFMTQIFGEEERESLSAMARPASVSYTDGEQTMSEPAAVESRTEIAIPPSEPSVRSEQPSWWNSGQARIAGAVALLLVGSGLGAWLFPRWAAQETSAAPGQSPGSAPASRHHPEGDDARRGSPEPAAADKLGPEARSDEDEPGVLEGPDGVEVEPESPDPGPSNAEQRPEPRKRGSKAASREQPESPREPKGEDKERGASPATPPPDKERSVDPAPKPTSEDGDKSIFMKRRDRRRKKGEPFF